MKTIQRNYIAIILILLTICLPDGIWGKEPPQADSGSPVSALAMLLEAQNSTDLEKALSVARGEAAKAIAPSFANTARMGIKFDTKKLIAKESKENGNFTMLTVGVTAGRREQSRSRDMLVVATQIEGKWLITYMDDDLTEPKKEDYENTDVVSLETAEKSFEEWKERLSK